MKKIIVVGGGPAGIMAALEAKSDTNEVFLLEKNINLGKKLLLTGNGKCNFSNEELFVNHYSEDCNQIIEHTLSTFDQNKLNSYLMKLGLLTTVKNHGLYPFSEQSKSVLNVLISELNRKRIQIITNASAHKLELENQTYKLTYLQEEIPKTITGDSVILCCGGKAAPSTGSDGSGFKLARNLGVTVSNTYPVLVQLKSDFNKKKELSGVRAKAKVTAFVYNNDNQPVKVAESFGELQIVDFGLSGINIFQISRELTKPIEEKKKCEVMIDFLPMLSEEDANTFLENQLKYSAEKNLSQFFEGMIHNKVMDFMIKEYFKNPEYKISKFSIEQLRSFVSFIKHYPVLISGHNGYNNAQATRGGVLLSEVDEHFQSIKNPGLYFAGEMLDVDGECGGYNLHWAFASGYIAGNNAKL